MRVYGIRHHGPGSSLRLLEGLRDQCPDFILIEGPQDATPALKGLDLETISPPLSLAALDAKTRKLSAHYPFAQFSPEWVAITYAKDNDIPVAFIDQQFSSQKGDDELVKDPLGRLAKASGYDDAEKWWEVHFENHESAAGVFEDIIELVRAVRPDAPSTREKVMVNNITQHITSKGNNCAVICGAWHAPILNKWQDHSGKDTPSSKEKHEYYWLPWNYEKMTIAAGYSAGVRAPFYYECLFKRPDRSTELFLAEAGKTIRSHGFQISSAQLIDTAHLAQQLAALRNRSLPGIDELWEGLVTILPDNRQSVIEVLQKAIFVGKASGTVDPDTNQLPLIQDFHHLLKRFRMSTIVGHKEDKLRKLDLRKPRHLALSQFFHQLLLLDLDWPMEEEDEVDHTGHYFQYWNLKWHDEVEGRLVEKAQYGVTVRAAAAEYIKDIITDLSRPEVLWDKLLWVIMAGLSHIAPSVMNRGKELLMVSDDGLSILLSWLNLERIKLYVNILDFDHEAITKVSESLLPKLFITLRQAYSKLDEEDTRTLAQALLAFHTSRLPDRGPWQRLLKQYFNDTQAPPVIGGLSMRLLIEEEVIDLQEARTHLNYQFSMDRDLVSTALWIEGFLLPGKLEILQGSGMLEMFDDWISSLEEDPFRDVVFGLRRSFNALQPGEKQQLLQLVRYPVQTGKKSKERDIPWTSSSFLELFRRLVESG